MNYFNGRDDRNNIGGGNESLSLNLPSVLLARKNKHSDKKIDALVSKVRRGKRFDQENRRPAPPIALSPKIQEIMQRKGLMDKPILPDYSQSSNCYNLPPGSDYFSIYSPRNAPPPISEGIEENEKQSNPSVPQHFNDYNSQKNIATPENLSSSSYMNNGFSTFQTDLEIKQRGTFLFVPNEEEEGPQKRLSCPAGGPELNPDLFGQFGVRKLCSTTETLPTMLPESSWMDQDHGRETIYSFGVCNTDESGRSFCAEELGKPLWADEKSDDEDDIKLRETITYPDEENNLKFNISRHQSNLTNYISCENGGKCRPCMFVATPRGCVRDDCKFCHSCPQNTQNSSHNNARDTSYGKGTSERIQRPTGTSESSLQNYYGMESQQNHRSYSQNTNRVQWSDMDRERNKEQYRDTEKSYVTQRLQNKGYIKPIPQNFKINNQAEINYQTNDYGNYQNNDHYYRQSIKSFHSFEIPYNNRGKNNYGKGMNDYVNVSGKQNMSYDQSMQSTYSNGHQVPRVTSITTGAIMDEQNEFGRNSVRSRNRRRTTARFYNKN